MNRIHHIKARNKISGTQVLLSVLFPVQSYLPDVPMIAPVAKAVVA